MAHPIARWRCAWLVLPLLPLGPTAVAQTPAPAPAVSAAPSAPAESASAPAAQTITVTGARNEGWQPGDSGALGIALPARELPVSVSLISAEFLRDFKLSGLNDLANYVPGVTLDDNGGETGESLLIRGFSTSTVFIDGLRTKARYGVPRSLPDVLERVEITKGPAGAEVGIAEFGGSVNLVTKKPRRAFAAETDAAVGDHGYRKVSFDITGAVAADGALQARLIAAAENPAEWRRGRPDTWRAVIAPSLNWDYAPSGSVLLQAERYLQESPQDRGIVYLEGAFPSSNFAPRDWSIHQTSDRHRRRFDRFALDWNHAFSDALAARVRLQQYDERRHLREFRNGDTEPDSGDSDLYNDDGRSWNGNREIAIFYSDWRENYRTRNAVAELTGRFALAGVQHTLRGGLEAYRFKILPGSEFADTDNRNTIDLFEPRNDQQPVDLAVLGSPFVDSGSSRQDSTYATWLAAWTPRARTVVGLRRDRYREQVQSTVDGVPDFGFALQSATTSWRVAGSWDLAPTLTVFAGLSNAFQPQSGITRSGSPLGPTGGRGVEAGLKWSLLDGKALWSTSVFQTTQNNISGCDTDASLPPEDVAQCRFSVLLGAARVRGLESQVQGAYNGVWQFSGGVALLQSRINKTQGVYVSDAQRLGQSFEGNRFANTPRWQASAALTYRWRDLGLPALKTSLGVVHVGERFGNPGNTIRLPAYTVVDLGVAYDITPQATLSLHASNLFDRTYYTAMQASEDRADQVGVGDRRLLQAALSWRF